MDWRQFKILDNALVNWIWFIAILFVAFLVRKYLSRLIGLLLFKIFRRDNTKNNLGKFQSLVVPPLQFLIYFLIVRAAVEMLYYPAMWKITIFKIPLQKALGSLLQLVIWWGITWLLLRMIEFGGFLMQLRAAKTESKLDDQWVPFFKDFLKVLLLVFSSLFLLGVIFELNITSLLAGIGIGGLAIALAAQESLKNLFGSLTIFMDQPFILGDQVKIGDVQGEVEKIGFRSTRIRTAEKTYVTLPNKVMVDSYVDNISMRSFRRVSMTIGLKYDTKPETLRTIISELQQHFQLQGHSDDEETDDYVVFDSFGESSLNIAIQYFIPHKPYLEFLKEKQEMNFTIMQIVTKHGAEFAYPVREIKMVSEDKSEPSIRQAHP